MAKAEKMHADVPQQGLSVKLSPEEAIAFIDAEQSYYMKHANFFDAPVNLFGSNLGQSGTRYSNELNKLKSQIQANDVSGFAKYIKLAQECRVLVDQSSVGELVAKWHSDGRSGDALITALLYSSEWMTNNNVKNAFSALRAVAFASPGFLATSDVVSANFAVSDARKAWKQTSEETAKLDAYIEEKRDVFDKLEQVYREKIVLEEPAKFWEDTQRSKTRAMVGWLFVFILLAVVPVALAVLYSDSLVQFVQHVTASQSGISLGGVAAITVPALFYGWVLKNISRLFSQSLVLADDAGHRRALAITYLGLAENDKLNISEPERALVLNALFRPLPNHSADEGPPSGILDLLKSKP